MASLTKNTPVTCTLDFSRSLLAEVNELKCELAHSDRNRDAFISPPALWPMERLVTSSTKWLSTALLGMLILDAFRLCRVAVFLLVSVHTYDS